MTWAVQGFSFSDHAPYAKLQLTSFPLLLDSLLGQTDEYNGGNDNNNKQINLKSLNVWEHFTQRTANIFLIEIICLHWGLSSRSKWRDAQYLGPNSTEKSRNRKYYRLNKLFWQKNVLLYFKIPYRTDSLTQQFFTWYKYLLSKDS